MSMQALAVFGGTFDPVHLGHLRAAWEASEQLAADVLMMPARVPPHRPPTVASAEQRVEMLAAALRGQSRLRLDERELRRDGPSYTVDTLVELRTERGPRRPLVLLVGADAFAGLDRWHRWQDLFELAHVGVLTRPGASTPPPSQALASFVQPRLASVDADWRESPAGAVLSLPVTPLEISASAVRALLREGRSPRYLLPRELLESPQLLASYRGARSM